MRDLYNLHKFYSNSKSSKQLNNRRKSFGYQVLGFGSGGSVAFVYNDEGIFGYGGTPSKTAVTNKVANTGVVATDVAGVGTARSHLAATQYGADKGIFGYGTTPSKVSMTNLVSNSGVVASDVSGVGTDRGGLSACSYSNLDKGIFGYGEVAPSPYTASMTNLISNVGVVSADVAGVGSARYLLAACEFGGDKGIFALGYGPGHQWQTVSNIISNTGVAATDVSFSGTGRQNPGGCSYGGDKGIFAYGYSAGSPSTHSMSNLVSNVGVIGSDVTGVGTAREVANGACEYGQGKAIFGYGGGPTNITNLVSDVGVVSADVSGVGTARQEIAACSFN